MDGSSTVRGGLRIENRINHLYQVIPGDLLIVGWFLRAQLIVPTNGSD